jgi:adenylate cyclase
VAEPIDFEAEGFLDGLEGAARDERRELLAWLVDQGFGRDQLERAHRRGLLLFLPSEREVGGEAKYTHDDISRLSGADPGLLLRIRQAQGLPMPEPGVKDMTEVDLEAARTARAMRDVGLTEEQMVDATRIIGRGLSRASEAMRTVMLETVLEPGTTERELAERYGAAVHGVMPLVGPMMLQMLSQHLRNMVQTEAIGASERAAGTLPGARDLTVGFADLVGFTRLGEEIPADELGAVANRFAELAGDVVEPPVRIVKTIGDAVLLTSTETAPLVKAGLDLVDATARAGEEFPQIRVGAARGPALARGGDVFGRSVNLASRVTGVARAGSVLATRDVRDAAREDFSWSRAGTRRIKGLPEPVPLYRARPREEGS